MSARSADPGRIFGPERRRGRLHACGMARARAVRRLIAWQVALECGIGGWALLPIAALQVRAGISNVLDKDPPFIPAADISGAAGSINSFPTYDLAGREIFLALHATL